MDEMLAQSVELTDNPIIDVVIFLLIINVP